MRADAARRREALILAARDVLAERGHDAPLDAIAERAGVGIATLYRNFPTRDDLAHAVARRTLIEAGAAADRALAAMASDPERAWTEFVDTAVRLRLGALIPALIVESYRELPDDVLEIREGTKARVTELVHAAQRAGLVRDDVRPIEVIMAVARLTRPHVRFVDDVVPGLVPRMIAIYLAGLRPDGRPLPR
ncbi:TetR/AcrR family transcriptional regulator [Rhodococcus ruber]|uniref:TetR/AcrR family transcriptional regulator n=1 Tax=Rhodococcus TaxID=1827 RepID=UPI0006611EEB|nr:MULTISPECIES: TetR/AcrR family transcriptional regulator [Rhodococcus]AUM19509.1 TetR/AcrR family transcriptional regulator [Rhodococcus ruber]MBP2214526.1 AcrR family transcriptional regulator [Rhodococcus ruber]MDO1480448.1 helix-turn-helix transcriptional regulator [Rhodococcus ruber]QDC12877.1 TetR family transcriptional regulator [Rhodococcus ruber]QRE79406.1 helix-turn-helix transcriptional regulator [Rhodococcus ruber]